MKSVSDESANELKLASILGEAIARAHLEDRRIEVLAGRPNPRKEVECQARVEVEAIRPKVKT